MFVYRIEDEEGVGMYWSKKITAYTDDDYPVPIDEGKHPPPYRDSLINTQWSLMTLLEQKEYIFGFSSLGQLRNWIYNNDWLMNLHAKGFVISVFEIDEEDVIKGYTQALFIRSKSISCCSYDIKEFFGL